MSAWSDKNAIKAFEYGFNIPSHRIQLGHQFKLIRLKYDMMVGKYINIIIYIFFYYKRLIEYFCSFR